MIDYIQGEKFIHVPDFKYYCGRRGRGINSSYKNNFEKDFVAICEKDIVSVYTHTHFIKHLFSYLNIIQTNKKIVLVSNNSDEAITQDLYDAKPSNIIKWYSQNVDCVGDDIESIPIGLENSYWYVRIHKLQKIKDKVNERKKTRNLVYMNHNIRTNPAERQRPYDLLHEKSWVTANMRKNGQAFDEYLDDIYNHKFVISPRGNGLDTHRTWECLYVNTIPIEKRNLNNRFYTDLPICFIDDWEEVTEDFLEREYIRINDIAWDTMKLDFGYWENKIKCTIQ